MWRNGRLIVRWSQQDITVVLTLKEPQLGMVAQVARLHIACDDLSQTASPARRYLRAAL
jgi:hypothetical protein